MSVVLKENDDLPEGWVKTTMGDLVEYVTSGSRGWKKYYAGKGAAFIRTQNIKTYQLVLNDVAYVDLPEKVEGKRTRVYQDDILVTITGANVGKVAHVKKEIKEAYVSQSVALIRLKNKEMAPYLYYHLRTKEGASSQLESLAYGMGRPVLNLDNIKEVNINLAPPEQQKRIVAKIEELFSHIDAGIEALKKAKQLLKQYRQSVLKAAVTGELTKEWREKNDSSKNQTSVLKKDMLNRIEERFQKKIAKWEAEVEAWKSNGSKGKKPKKPKMRKELCSLTENEKERLPYLPESWEWIKLGELAETITKGASPKWQGINYVNDPKQVLFVTSENVREGYIDIDSPKYLEISFNEKQPNSILNRNDLLINIVGASIGRAARFEIDVLANINQAVSLVRVHDDSISEFLKYYLNSMIATNYYSENQVDVARANLSLVDIQNIPIPLCDRNEILEILNSIQSKLESIDRLESELSKQQSKAEKNKQSVLAAAFGGKLTPGAY